VGVRSHGACARRRTLHAAALEEDFLLEAQAIQHLPRRELEFARDGAALEDRSGQVDVALYHQVAPACASARREGVEGA
tara:strand:+ start:500 stop:736 length:237 start_codon:yes stop_codon:yes gene_type:complete